MITSSKLSKTLAKVLDIEIADHLSTITLWKKIKKDEEPITAQSTNINYEKFNSLSTNQMCNTDDQNATDSMKYLHTGCVISLGTEFQMGVAQKGLKPHPQNFSQLFN